MVDSKAKFIDNNLLPHLVEVRLATTIRTSMVGEMVYFLRPFSRFRPLSIVRTYATAVKPSVDPTDVDDLAVNLSYCDCNH